MGSNVVLPRLTAFSSCLKSLQTTSTTSAVPPHWACKFGEKVQKRKSIANWGTEGKMILKIELHLSIGSCVLLRKHPVRDLVSVKCLRQVCVNNHIHTDTRTVQHNTCSRRQHTELVLDLSSVMKPIRIILCTDEDSTASCSFTHSERKTFHICVDLHHILKLIYWKSIMKKVSTYHVLYYLNFLFYFLSMIWFLESFGSWSPSH